MPPRSHRGHVTRMAPAVICRRRADFGPAGGYLAPSAVGRRPLDATSGRQPAEGCSDCDSASLSPAATMLFSLAMAAVVTLALYRLYAGDVPPRVMFDVYTRPGIFYYPKVATFWLFLTFRKWKAARDQRRGAQPGTAAGYGVKSRASPAEMDCVQPLAEHPRALDAVLFQGAAGDGSWLVLALARRPRGVSNTICLVTLPGVGTLQMERHPDTTVFGDEHSHAGGGFRLTPLEPMRCWRLQFSGKMRLDEKLVDVTFDLTYRSDLPYFDFDTDMAPLAVARAMALEPWTREFFERLRDAHQTHYEQIGTTSGTVTVSGREHRLQVTGMRDHSYARYRDWTLLHRYGLHTLIMEDGTRAQVGVVSQPYSFSRIELGYLYTPEGRLHALDWCDLELGYHGEQGTPPADYGFSFGAGGRTYHALVKVEDVQEVYIGWEWEARILERRCSYRVNGLSAHGVSEWYYRHHGGRPERYVSADPAWSRDIEK
ncbi:uncharacterized protein LOC122381218 [Amphibalanus amphitrite]|uniref:uncharacterized protein LOC122381218 n=1 Tax=Amphibalanus amphitrite TaxID=1232801 RepID=UPI001C914394|nr:uncharacterized protein LOC122381218 [Amphibalanus amphitrite]